MVWDPRRSAPVPVSRDLVGTHWDQAHLEAALEGEFEVTLADGKKVAVRPGFDLIQKYALDNFSPRAVEEMTWTWKLPTSPLRVYFGGTHMHYVGRDMSVKLENTNPQEGEDDDECLIHTPAWDFNWQGGYGYEATFDELPQMNDGDVLHLRCVFDNSITVSSESEIGLK